MKLNKKIIDKIYEHALKEYPDECCGIVTGAGDDQIIHICENIQNKLHAEDPERFPRDARTAYFIERTVVDRIISFAKQKGHEIITFYHSHAEHEAYFSEEDVAAQTVFGEPEFPDALHVVVSVTGRTIDDIKGFIWDGKKQNFVGKAV